MGNNENKLTNAIYDNRMNHVAVQEYNDDWPIIFKKEAALIQRILGDCALDIHHVGSTAIPGLAAKPIIDIIPVVDIIQNVDSKVSEFEKEGYLHKGELGIPFRRYFKKDKSPIGFNVHIYEKDNPEIERLLLFKQYLIKNPDKMLAYGALKKELAQKYPNDIDAYCDAKTDFILDIDNKAGFDGLRIVMTCTKNEWKSYHHIRKTEIFDKIGVEYNPNHPSITDPDNYHFALYKGSHIIGTSQFEFLENNVAVLRTIAIHNQFQKLGYGQFFLSKLMQWLKQNGKDKILTHVNPEALSFYTKIGFNEMPFSEPAKNKIYVKTIPMVKKLNQ